MLTPNQFISIDDKHKLHPKAYAAFQAMCQAAKKAGVSIDIASSYRSVERQLQIWNAKWEGSRLLYQRDMTQVDPKQLSDEDKLHCILTFSALPGASRHHWGTDIDVYDAHAVAESGKPLALIEDEYVVGGPCYAMHQWLLNHAEQFGFYFPYAEDTGGIAKEPWHISHRQTAQQALDSLTLGALQSRIEKLPISGKATILKYIDVVYHRYVLNKGIDS